MTLAARPAGLVTHSAVGTNSLLIACLLDSRCLCLCFTTFSTLRKFGICQMRGFHLTSSYSPLFPSIGSGNFVPTTYARNCTSSIECFRFFYCEGYNNITIPVTRPVAAVQAEEVKQLEEAITCTPSMQNLPLACGSLKFKTKFYR